MSTDVETQQGDPPSLRSLLETLPQELYDNIYDLTFTAQAGIRYVNKPPEKADTVACKRCPLFISPDHVGLLQVDRHSRATFARSYYGGKGAVFVCDHNGTISEREKSWRPWLDSVNRKHRAFIQDMRCVVAKCASEYWEDWHRKRFTDSAKASKIKEVAQQYVKDLAPKLECGIENDANGRP